MSNSSAVTFPGQRRIHIGLAVADLDRSRAFYELLFGTAPTKERPGYLKFEVADPSINLSLNEVNGGSTQNASADKTTHYGVQVKSPEAVQAAIARFRAAGIEPAVEQETTCCYAVQDKAWVTDPDGNHWEVFVVLQADAEQRKSADSTCCAGNDSQQASSCC